MLFRFGLSSFDSVSALVSFTASIDLEHIVKYIYICDVKDCSGYITFYDKPFFNLSFYNTYNSITYNSITNYFYYLSDTIN